jgi:hypothetical protein
VHVSHARTLESKSKLWMSFGLWSWSHQYTSKIGAMHPSRPLYERTPATCGCSGQALECGIHQCASGVNACLELKGKLALMGLFS